MNIPKFDPKRRTAIRAALAFVVSSKRPRRRLPVWAAIAVFVAAGALTGGAVSAAAVGLRGTPTASPFTIGSPAGLKGVPALPGTEPGSPIVSLLTGGGTLDATASQAVPLAAIPPKATDVRVRVTCIAAGTISWGLDPSGNNPNSTCLTSDVGTDNDSTFYDFSLQGSPKVLQIGISGHWLVSYQYVRKVETAWGVNAHGQTYGVEKPGEGSPILLAVQGVKSDGTQVDGFAFASQLQGPMPTSPTDAGTFAEKLKEQHPDGIPVPVYKADGTTRVGTFYVGAD